MLTEKQIRAKLYNQAERFNKFYIEKRWSQAKYCYDTAERVALFLEVDDEIRWKLFGGSEDYEEDPLFDHNKVCKVYEECCVKRDLSRQDEERPRTIQEALQYQRGLIKN